MTNLILKNYANYNLAAPRLRTVPFFAAPIVKLATKPAEILFITSYPPRECGIATYSKDLITALNNKFGGSFNIKICAVENSLKKHWYHHKADFVLDTDEPADFYALADRINEETAIKLVLIQHEFGFYENREEHFIAFLQALTKPVTVVFHTVLPNPSLELKAKVNRITDVAVGIIVMTHSSATILEKDYGIKSDMVTVIPHGTHLVPHADPNILKLKYGLMGKKVLSTFGLLSSGKSIETTLKALPVIVANCKDAMFLIIGKTHPGITAHEGERYREKLQGIVTELRLDDHVRFINKFLPLPELLDYLQLTDIYLFTSKDPNQAVSGTFSYAISCGCPIISTPIPHACEVLKDDAGIIIGFDNNIQLANAAMKILSDEHLSKKLTINGLHRMAPTAWENTAIAHAALFEKLSPDHIKLSYKLPPINFDHLKKMTTGFGLIQFSKINQPDLTTGYTLDDNARALVAMCQHFEMGMDECDIEDIALYFNFIKYCQQADGSFLNYVNINETFTAQNFTTNLEDANGRAIWALGYMLSLKALLPNDLVFEAETVLQNAIANCNNTRSTRAMAFIIKGMYYHSKNKMEIMDVLLIMELADRLLQMYRHEATGAWKWYESYLTYANSILPEAMLCAWLATGEPRYKEVAKSSFDFCNKGCLQQKLAAKGQ